MSTSVKDRIASARGHLRRGEQAEAEALLLTLAEEHPRFADVHNELGLLFHDRGDFARAEAEFQKALAINPAYTEAALHLSITWNDLGRYEEARRVYADVLERASGDATGISPALAKRVAPLYVQIGELYAHAGLSAPAAEAYRAALDLCPAFHDVRLRRAQALLDAGEPGAAIEEIDVVLAAKAGQPGALVALGLAHHAAGHRDQAAEIWRSVLETDPANTQAALYLRLLPGEQRSSA